jgi:hypothetical protein
VSTPILTLDRADDIAEAFEREARKLNRYDPQDQGGMIGYLLGMARGLRDRTIAPPGPEGVAVSFPR